jgi:hypothetical protein
MRVWTALKRLLRLPGASVIDLSFGTEGARRALTLAFRSTRARRRLSLTCPL